MLFHIFGILRLFSTIYGIFLHFKDHCLVCKMHKIPQNLFAVNSILGTTLHDKSRVNR